MNTIYCIVNNKEEIQKVAWFGMKEQYFNTDTVLKDIVKFHNNICKEDPWKIQKFKLIAEQKGTNNKYEKF